MKNKHRKRKKWKEGGEKQKEITVKICFKVCDVTRKMKGSYIMGATARGMMGAFGIALYSSK